MAQDHEQDRLYERHVNRGYHARAVKKLQKLPKYAEADLDELATSLTEFEPFRTKYDCFPASVEETSKGYTMDAAADSVWVEANRLPRELAMSKVKERYEKVCKFPVKLVLRVKKREDDRPVMRTFGAQLDAALIVWDHILEWDSSSLVIPKPVNLKTLPPTLMTSVLHESKWSTFVTNQQSKFKKVVRSPTDKLHRKEIDLLVKLTTKKDSLIAAMINTVIHYNRHKQYDERDCNNHHFIHDVTTAMGIKKLPAIGESLGALLERSRLLCVETLPRTEFVDHADLDDFIHHCCESSSLSELGICDVEYLIIKYFHFHVRHWELSHYPDQWTCQEPDCQLKCLEEQLDKLSLSSERPCAIM